MAPFCAATKVAVVPEEEQPENRMDSCHNCGQFRSCSYYNGEWYCIAKCRIQASRGVLSRKRAQDIPPRRER